MRRAALLAAVAAVASVLASTAGAADPSGPRVVEAKGPAFPVRTYVLTLPKGQKLSIHDVNITENGRPVVAPTLVPASEAAK